MRRADFPVMPFPNIRINLPGCVDRSWPYVGFILISSLKCVRKVIALCRIKQEKLKKVTHKPFVLIVFKKKKLPLRRKDTNGNGTFSTFDAMRIILITGGQRSGKSEEAERLALSLSPCPVYMATARVYDEDFRQRVRVHQERRGQSWTNIEEEKMLSRHDVSGRVVLIDCLTLWAANFLFDVSDNPDNSTVKLCYEQMVSEFDRFTSSDATFIFVTNEIGMGGVSDNSLQRHFTDLQGLINQYVARKADEVYLMVCGLSHRIK